MEEIRRLPCQLRWITGEVESAIQGRRLDPSDPLNNVEGNWDGIRPAADAALTCRVPLAGRAIESSSESRPAPGSASADARSCKLVVLGTVKVLAIGETAAGLANVTGDGTCWSKEELTEGAWQPCRSWAASSRSGLSSSSWTPMLEGRSMGWSNVICIHCPTGVVTSPSAQAVAGLPSNALTGSSCCVSVSQEP